MRSFSPISAQTTPPALTAVGILLIFGACMASLAGTSFTFPGTSLRRIWALNPQAYAQLAPLGRIAGLVFVLLGTILGIAAAGWFKRRAWGWRLTVGLIATQVLGGIINILSSRVFGGLTGAIVAGAFLIYLLQARVRSVFHSDPRR
jgi:hypothetical protein